MLVLSCLIRCYYGSILTRQNCVERQPLPAGYVFVPKGDVYITRHCRSQTKEAQQVVYVVYVSLDWLFAV